MTTPSAAQRQHPGIMSGVIVDMTQPVEAVLESFDRLPEEAKREAAAEILKRSTRLDLPPLDNGDLVEAAEGVFLALDREEFEHG